MTFVTKLVAAVAGLVLIGFIIQGNLNRDTAQQMFKWRISHETPLPVQTEPVVRGNIVHSVAAPGEVEAEFKVELSSQVQGRIERMPSKAESIAQANGQLREGDKVTKGQVLVLLDSRIYRERLRGSESLAKKIESSLPSMRADVEKAKRDMQRNDRLLAARSIGAAEAADSLTIVQKMEAQLLSCVADLEAARANADQARKDLEECTIKSPIDGVISKMSAEEGENVIIGTMNNAGTTIMTISDMNSIVVRARVDETYIPLVKVGQRAKIYLQCDGESILTGTVKRVAPKGEKGKGGKNSNAASQAAADPNELAKFETLIAIDNPPSAIRLGMTANIEIQVNEKRNVLAIPPHAVLQRRAKDLPPELTKNAPDVGVKKKGFEDPAKRWFQVVFVDVNGHAKCKVVHTGISDENKVEVIPEANDADGLHENERVIVGPFRVFDKLRQDRPLTAFVDPGSKGSG